MHIHGNSMNVGAASSNATALSQRAVAAQQAAEVRKKQLKGAAGSEGAATSEESLLIGQWMDSQHSQVQSQKQYHASSSGQDGDFS